MNVPHSDYPAPILTQPLVAAQPVRAEITVPQLAFVQAIGMILPYVLLIAFVWWVFRRKRK